MATVTSTTSSPVPAFMRRRSSASMPASQSLTTIDLDDNVDDNVAVGVVDTLNALNALTSYFLPEATAASIVVADAVCADMTESLLTFHVTDEQMDEDEYNLPESILPMSPEVSPRGRSASALSQAALEGVSATLTSWFSFEDFEGDDEALEDEYVNEMDDDFLMDDEPVMENVQDELPTPAKLSLIAEDEDFSKETVAAFPWAMKALGWPWVRSN